MRRSVALLVAILALTSLSAAQPGFRIKTRTAAELFADQRRAVGTWCRQDYEGLRLTEAGWQRFKPVTTLKSNPDFNTIIIVSRFQFEPRESASWDVGVSYAVLGKYERGAGYFPDSGFQNVTFQTRDIDGQVVITNIEPPSPYVSKKAAIEWMKKELESTASDLEKAHLKEALKQLEPQAPASDVNHAQQ